MSSGTWPRLAGIPVTTSLMGLGAFPADDELFLGMPGMHGTGYANLALHYADVILCVGNRLDDRVTGKLDAFAPKAQFIHVDVDASEIGKNLPCLVPIVGDAKPVLRAMAEGAAQWEDKPDYSLWRDQIETWKSCYPMTYRDTSPAIAPQAVVETLGRILPQEAIVVTGVGQHQMYTAQFYPFKTAPHPDHQRRPGHHGLRPARGGGGQGGFAGQGGGAHRRRRLLPDDHPGAGHGGALQGGRGGA